MNTTWNSRQWKQTRKWTCDLKVPVNNNYKTISLLIQAVLCFKKINPPNNKKHTVIIYKNYSKVSITAYGWNISTLQYGI